MDMDKLRDSVNIAAVIGSRIPLTQRGHEYVALCPFHDEQSPSFYVLPQKQFFHCFGCSVSGDVVAFLQQFDGISFLEACEVLSHQPASPLPMRPGLKASSKEQDWISEVPPDTDPRPASMTTRNHGEVTASWCYKTLEGAVWGYAARYEIVRDGVTKKAVLQWTYGKSADETTSRWACKHFSRLRPLYGLEHLYQPDKQVLIVEGEKTVEAARVLFPTMVVVTWPGGASAAKYADWAPLTERECVMLPDADPEGKAAGLWICDHLDTLGCSVRMITPNRREPRAGTWRMRWPTNGGRLKRCAGQKPTSPSMCRPPPQRTHPPRSSPRHRPRSAKMRWPNGLPSYTTRICGMSKSGDRGLFGVTIAGRKTSGTKCMRRCGHCYAKR